MVMYKLEENIEGQGFVDLIHLCFKQCTCFSLTFNGYKDFEESNDHRLVFEELKPYLMKEVTTQHWHCHYVPNGYEIKVNLYKTCESSMAILLNHYDNLYLNSNHPESLSPINLLPENICFFKDELLFLGTVSHESICNLYLVSNHLLDVFQVIGVWKQVDSLDNEQICIDIT